MAKRKFKPGGTSVGFKSIGQGLKQSQYEIQKRAQQDIDALKLAQRQHKEATNINISGLADKARFEENVQNEKDRLEGAVRQRQQEALSIKAARDVDRIKGEALEHGKRAEYWKDLTPKMAKAAAQIATGLWNVSEGMEAQAMAEAYRKNPNTSLKDLDILKQHKNIQKQKAVDTPKIETLSELNYSTAKTSGRSNVYYSKKVLNEGNKNRAFHEQEIKQLVDSLDDPNDPNDVSFTKDTAVKWYVQAAYLHLDRHGIKATSAGGRAIIQQWENWGIAESFRLQQEDNWIVTDGLLKDGFERLNNNPEDRDEIMTELRKTISLGTLKNEKTGEYSSGITNTADQFEWVLSEYLKRHGKGRYTTAAEVREFIESFAQDGEVGKDDKDKKSYCSRHTLRCNRIVDAWGAANDRGKIEKDKQTKAENNLLKTEFNQREKEHRRRKEEDPDYKTSDEEFYVKEVKLASEYTTGDKDAKEHVYHAADLVTGSYKHADKWANVQHLINNNELDDATRLFSSFTAAEQKALLPTFTALKGLGSYSEGGAPGKQGWQLVAYKVNKIFKDGEKTNTLDMSGEATVNIMIERVASKYHAMVADGVDPIKAINQAIEEEHELWKQGVNDESPFEFPKDSSNPYSRRKKPYTSALYGESEQFFYGHAPETADQEKVESVKHGLKKGELSEEQKSYEINTITPELIHSRKGLYETWQQAALSPTVISPHEVRELRTVGQNLYLRKSAYEGDINAVIPDNIIAIAEAYGTTPLEVINFVIAKYNQDEKGAKPYEFRFQSDGTEMLRIQNGGKITKVSPGTSRYSELLAEEAFAQGVDPMPNEIFTYK